MSIFTLVYTHVHMHAHIYKNRRIAHTTYIKQIYVRNKDETDQFYNNLFGR